MQENRIKQHMSRNIVITLIQFYLVPTFFNVQQQRSQNKSAWLGYNFCDIWK